MSKTLRQLTLMFCAGALLLLGGWSSYSVYQYSTEVADIKEITASSNKASLQLCFIIFIGFVLFSLILSTILKRITSLEKRIIKP